MSHTFKLSFTMLNVNNNVTTQVFVVDCEAIVVVQHLVDNSGNLIEHITVKHADNRWYINNTQIQMINESRCGPISCCLPISCSTQCVPCPALVYQQSIDWGLVKRKVYGAASLTGNAVFVLKRRHKQHFALNVSYRQVGHY